MKLTNKEISDLKREIKLVTGRDMKDIESIESFDDYYICFGYYPSKYEQLKHMMTYETITRQNVKKFIGMKWSELSDGQQAGLLSTASPQDVETGNEERKESKCIICLNDMISVNGTMINNEMTPDADAVIYNPQDGVVEWMDRQQRYEYRNSIKSKAYKISSNTIPRYANACKKAGVTLGPNLDRIMNKYCDEILGVDCNE